MAEIIQEKWLKGVAVTTTCLAVMTAVAAARGAACGAKTQLLTTLESSQWSYYQAKSIKQNLAEVQKNAFEVEMLGASNADQKRVYDEKLRKVSEDATRYEKEKNQVKKEAEETAYSNKLLTKKNNFFSAAKDMFGNLTGFLSKKKI